MPNFKKQIWYLFKLNRDDFNKADRNVSKVLNEVYEKGKEAGRKEQIKTMQIYLKSKM